jgi:hypothetical protein
MQTRGFDVSELQIFAFVVLPIVVVAIAGGMLVLSRRHP